MCMFDRIYIDMCENVLLLFDDGGGGTISFLNGGIVFSFLWRMHTFALCSCNFHSLILAEKSACSSMTINRKFSLARSLWSSAIYTCVLHTYKYMYEQGKRSNDCVLCNGGANQSVSLFNTFFLSRSLRHSLNG